MRLQGQVALITGAGRGLGRAMALAFAAEGAAVVVTARSHDEIAETLWLIEEQGGQGLALPADVRHPAALQQLVAQTLARFGPIDVLVNNAGVGLRRPIQELTLADWELVFDTNVKGAYLSIQAVLPSMIERKRGNILNVTAPLAKIAIPGFGAYTSAKYALEGLTQTLARELRRYSINVNALHPGGFVATRLIQQTVPELKQGLLEPESIVPVALALAAQPPRGQTGLSVDAQAAPETLI